MGPLMRKSILSSLKDLKKNQKETHVCKLKKALYGLKQAPRAWYVRMDAYLLRLGFTKSSADPNLYIEVVQEEPIIILLYVDDLLVTGVDRWFQECKRQLAAEFDMKDLGIMHYYLGLEMWQKLGEIYLRQGKYVIKMLQKFGMTNCKPMMTLMVTNLKRLSSYSSPVDSTCYKQLIGWLIYLVNTRLDICFAVNVLSEFQMEPKHDHWITAK